MIIFPCHVLTDVLKWADDTTLRDIEIMLQYGEDYTFKKYTKHKTLVPSFEKGVHCKFTQKSGMYLQS